MDEPKGDISADGRSVWDTDHWEPLRLTAAQVVDAVMAGWGLQAEAPLRYLAEGLMNHSWQLSTAAGEFVVRVVRPDIDTTQLHREHWIVSALHRSVPEVVVPLPGCDGDTVQTYEGIDLVLYPYVAGQLANSVPQERWEHDAASLLARIHLAGLPLTERKGRNSVWSTVRPVLLRELDRNRIARAVDYLDREERRLTDWVAKLENVRIGIVHGDFNSRNLILRNDRIVAVIDWESCHADLVLAEASTLSPECFATYLESGGPAQPEDARRFPGFARLNTMANLYFAIEHGVEHGHAGRNAVQVLGDVVAELHELPTV
jgi:Ser/Thr protein kinase RdoA (MazF antagonist)